MFQMKPLLLSLALMTAPTAIIAESQDLESRHIAGGQVTSTKEFPFLVRVNTLAGRCTGTLIDHLWVLTAAHCVTFSNVIEPLPIQTLTVSHAISVGESTARVGKIIIHPNYSRTESGQRNDIALLRLASPARGPGVAYVPLLLLESQRMHAMPGTMATAVGWGELGDGSTPSAPRKVEWPIYDCPQDVVDKGAADEKSICTAGSFFMRSATGDSGGPLLVRVSGRWEQVGILAYSEINSAISIRNSGSLASIYTSIPESIEWIQTVLPELFGDKTLAINIENQLGLGCKVEMFSYNNGETRVNNRVDYSTHTVSEIASGQNESVVFANGTEIGAVLYLHCRHQ